MAEAESKAPRNSIVVTINGMYSAVGLDDDPSVALRVFEPDTWPQYGQRLGYALGKALRAQGLPRDG